MIRKDLESQSDAGLRVSLREVLEDDLELFFENQLDPDALRMTGFPSRDKDAHMAHWLRILTDPSVTAATVLFEGGVAGNIVSWDNDGERELGYWIGRSFWGRGVATSALKQFLEQFDGPPLHAHVTKRNAGSLRVLEKCGFVIVSEGRFGEVDEVDLFLASQD